MIEDTHILNIVFYLLFGGFVIFLTSYFALEFKIKRKRQKEWDRIKLIFNCTDELSLNRLFNAYKSTLKKHWLLGYIYPDM